MVEAVQVTKYRAFDGTLHDSAGAAEAHEEANFEAIISGLTIEQVRAAISREAGHIAIADALEKAGAMIAKRRRDSGELRRARNGEGKAPAGQDQAPAPDSAVGAAEPASQAEAA